MINKVNQVYLLFMLFVNRMATDDLPMKTHRHSGACVLRNTTQTYGWMAIGLHWLMAIGILGLFVLGVWMVKLDYYDTWYHRASDIHQDIGMLLLAMLVVRLFWAWFNIKPDIAAAAWERATAIAVHRLFYLLMLIVLVSGYLIPTAEGEGFDVFGWFYVPALWHLNAAQADMAGDIHRWSAWTTIGLTGLHAAAALKHHVVNRDNTLLNMMGISQR